MAISNLSTGLRPGVCTSSTRPTSPYVGQVILETDTGNLLEYYGSTTGWAMPWNLPWGQVSRYVESGSTSPSITTTTSTMLTSASFTPLANRLYRVTSTWAAYSAGGGNVVDFTHYWNGGTINWYYQYFPAAGTQMSGTLVSVGTLSVATGSVLLQARAEAGSGTFWNNGSTRNHITVEDIGPAGSRPAS